MLPGPKRFLPPETLPAAFLTLNAPCRLKRFFQVFHDIVNIFSADRQPDRIRLDPLIRKLRFYYPVDKYPMPPILLAAPGPLDPAKEEYCFDASSARKIEELPPRYEALARELNCLYFNAQTVLTKDDLVKDGIHLKIEGHAKLARAFTGIVRGHFRKS